MDNKSIIDDLNELQKEIVLAPVSNMMVIAGAGTGKTRVLISRIAYLIDAENVYPSSILAVTFTNKAAKEMSDRVMSFFKWTDTKGMFISTIHSMCLRFLRIYATEAMLAKDFSVITTSEQQGVIKSILSDYDIAFNDAKDLIFDDQMLDQLKDMISPRLIVEEIMRSKEYGKTYIGDPATLEKELKTLKKNWMYMSTSDFTNLMFYAYTKVCLKSNLLDFCDLIIKMKQLLDSNSQVRYNIQRRFKHIFIDEFQDTNAMQYQLMIALKGNSSYLFVVGDDDQAIYGWRGADYTNLLRLRQDVPDIQLYELTINYRSNQNILSFSNAVVSNNKNRLLDKKLVNIERFTKSYETDLAIFQNYVKTPLFSQYDIQELELTPDEVADDANMSARRVRDLVDLGIKLDLVPDALIRLRNNSAMQGEASAPKVKLVDIDSSYNESQCVQDIISRLVDQGYKYHEIAILYRNNFLSANLEEGMFKSGVPYEIFGGHKFYDRAEIQNVIAYLRLMLNVKDDGSFRRVINVPSRKIGNKSVEKLEEFARSIGLSLFETLECIILSKDKTGLAMVKKMVPFYETVVYCRSLIKQLPLRSLISEVAQRTGLIKMYEELDEKEKSARQGVARIDNIQQLIVNAESFEQSNMEEDNSVESDESMRENLVEEVAEEKSALERFEESRAQAENAAKASSMNQDMPGLMDLLDDVGFDEDEVKETSSKAQESSDDKTDASKEEKTLEEKRYEIFTNFVANAALVSAAESNAMASDNASKGVNLMTIHASKGLEFKAVIVIGCEAGLLPSSRSEDLTEEFRLGYVAFTRAMHDLYILSCRRRRMFKGTHVSVEPSEIIVEACKNLAPVRNTKLCPFISVRYIDGEFC